MHRFNVIAMAVIVSLSVVVAYSVRAANSAELVPQMTPMQDAMWIEQMSLPIQELTIQRRRDGLVEEAAKLTGRKRRCRSAAGPQGAAETHSDYCCP